MIWLKVIRHSPNHLSNPTGSTNIFIPFPETGIAGIPDVTAPEPTSRLVKVNESQEPLKRVYAITSCRHVIPYAVQLFAAFTLK